MSWRCGGGALQGVAPPQSRKEGRSEPLRVRRVGGPTAESRYSIQKKGGFSVEATRTNSVPGPRRVGCAGDRNRAGCRKVGRRKHASVGHVQDRLRREQDGPARVLRS